MFLKASAPGMNKLPLVFSPRAMERLTQIADYLSEQGLPNAFVIDYLNQLELWLQKVLIQIPRIWNPDARVWQKHPEDLL